MALSFTFVLKQMVDWTCELRSNMFIRTHETTLKRIFALYGATWILQYRERHGYRLPDTFLIFLGILWSLSSTCASIWKKVTCCVKRVGYLDLCHCLLLLWVCPSGWWHLQSPDWHLDRPMDVRDGQHLYNKRVKYRLSCLNRPKNVQLFAMN